jgi:glutathione peroxidase
MDIHDLTVTTIDGQPQSLTAYKGKVLLVVNTASECGFTPQYEGLEKLWQAYKGKDFALLGFPSNDFGGQEPGTDAEIKSFCSLRFKTTFPMFSKVKTKGDGASPLYAELAAAQGAPRWNFHKYLVGKDGRVIAAFPSKTKPEDPALRSAIDVALAAATPA